MSVCEAYCRQRWLSAEEGAQAAKLDGGRSYRGRGASGEPVVSRSAAGAGPLHSPTPFCVALFGREAAPLAACALPTRFRSKHFWLKH